MDRKKQLLLLMVTACLLLLAGCAKRDSDQGRPTENMSLETIYRIGLGEYLNEKLKLSEYEAQIAEAGCIPVDPDKKSEEQLKDRTGTKYIYIRNEIHTERLSPQDIETLKSGTLKEDGTLSDEIMDVVERTFPEVISSVDIRKGKHEGETIIYDMNVLGDTESYDIPVNALLLQIATQADRSGKDGVSREKEEEKENALYDISQKIESESKGLFENTPVCVRVNFVL